MSARKPTQMHTWERYVRDLYFVYAKGKAKTPIAFAQWYSRYKPKSEYAIQLKAEYTARGCPPMAGAFLVRINSQTGLPS